MLSEISCDFVFFYLNMSVYFNRIGNTLQETKCVSFINIRPVLIIHAFQNFGLIAHYNNFLQLFSCDLRLWFYGAGRKTKRLR